VFIILSLFNKTIIIMSRKKGKIKRAAKAKAKNQKKSKRRSKRAFGSKSKRVMKALSGAALLGAMAYGTHQYVGRAGTVEGTLTYNQHKEAFPWWTDEQRAFHGIVK
jgi:hypothetical protein